MVSQAAGSLSEPGVRSTLADIQRIASDDPGTRLALVPEDDVEYTLQLGQLFLSDNRRHDLEITGKCFVDVIGEALQALETGQFHTLNYLGQVRPRETAQALLALHNISHGQLRSSSLKPLLDIPNLEGGDAWRDFLQGFGTREKSGWEKLIQGAATFLHVTHTVGQDLLFGGAVTLADVAEPADIRFSTLLTRAVEIVRGREESIKVGTRRRWILFGGRKESTTTTMVNAMEEPSARVQKQIRTHFTFTNLPLPVSHEAVRTIAEEMHGLLASHPDASGLIAALRGDSQRATRLWQLFYYVYAYGSKTNARTAAEVLLLLGTERFEQRAENPLGQVTEHFPYDLDGTDKGQVIVFLRDLLLMPITEELEEDVWEMWQEAWNQDVITAEDWRMDLDETNYEFKMNYLTGRTRLSLRDTVVYNVALALKYRRPIPFGSFTHASRIADYANHPLLAAFRFAHTLRMPEDLPVRREEILDETRTFESITDQCAQVLQDFAKRAKDVIEPRWEEPATRMLAWWVRKLTGSLRFRGIKDVSVFRKAANGGPYMLVDDKAANVHAYVTSGGHGGIIVPTHAPVMGTHEDRIETRPTVLAQAKTVKESRRHLVLEASSALFPHEIWLGHEQWALKAYFGFGKPILGFVSSLLGSVMAIRRWPKQVQERFYQLLDSEYEKHHNGVLNPLLPAEADVTKEFAIPAVPQPDQPDSADDVVTQPGGSNPAISLGGVEETPPSGAEQPSPSKSNGSGPTSASARNVSDAVNGSTALKIVSLEEAQPHSSQPPLMIMSQPAIGDDVPTAVELADRMRASGFAAEACVMSAGSLRLTDQQMIDLSSVLDTGNTQAVHRVLAHVARTPGRYGPHGPPSMHVNVLRSRSSLLIR